MTAEEDFVHPP